MVTGTIHARTRTRTRTLAYPEKKTSFRAQYIIAPGNIILSVVLYGCETWSLTLREERRLRVFENMVLRRVCGPKRDEVTGELRELHNEELRDFYSLPNIVRVVKSRRMRCAGRVVRMGEGRSVHRCGETRGKEAIGETHTQMGG